MKLLNIIFHFSLFSADPELNLVPAIDIAIKRMKRGERSRLKVASKYGFGPAGNPGLGVPPDMDLIYDVTLLKFEKAKESWEMTDDERIQRSKEVKNDGNRYFKVRLHHFWSGFKWFSVVKSKITKLCYN